MGSSESRTGTAAFRHHIGWMPDQCRPGCFHCEATFTFSQRRHHCRLCGEIFCKGCWGEKKVLPVQYFKSIQADELKVDQPVCSCCAAVIDGKLELLRNGVHLILTRVATKTADPKTLDPRHYWSKELMIPYILKLSAWHPFNRGTHFQFQAEDSSQQLTTPVSVEEAAGALRQQPKKDRRDFKLSAVSTLEQRDVDASPIIKVQMPSLWGLGCNSILHCEVLMKDPQMMEVPPVDGLRASSSTAEKAHVVIQLETVTEILCFVCAEQEVEAVEEKEGKAKPKNSVSTAAVYAMQRIVASLQEAIRWGRLRSKVRVSTITSSSVSGKRYKA